MPTPAPPVELHDHCSAIFNNTLYVFSPDAFQSLPLENDTQWNELPMGVSVTGGTCVLAFPNSDPNQASLYIVGGSTNSSSVIFPGLQSYSFQDQKWSNVQPVVPVTQNRKHHGATYLNTSSSILVYGGSQNGDSGPSSETFIISTQTPFNVQAYSSAAPPVVDPILLPWSDNRAAVMGGDPTNTKIFTFGPDTGWQDAGISLTTGLKDTTKVQCAIVNGDDGSKVLETFDMSTSPNTVTGTVLLEAGGLPAPAGQFIGNSTQPPAKRRKRNTLADWPTYNNTLAPTSTRSGFSLAQGANGLIVITGGNQQDPISIFDGNNDGWLNATNFLNIKQTTTSSSTPSATSSVPSASASSSEAPTVGGSTSSSRAHTLKILGVTLGAIFGFAAILILCLLLLRYYRVRRDQGHKRKSSDFPSDKPGRLSFQDRGIDAEPLNAAAGPMGTARRPADSVAIMSGRDISGDKPGPVKRTDVFLPSMRFSRTPSPLGKGTHLGEEVHMRDITKTADTTEGPPPRPPRGDRLTDEGWSRYFQGNNASNLANMNSGVRSTYDSQESRSDYRNSAWPHGSAEVAPLNLGRFGDSQQLNHVAYGSPTTEHAAANGRGTGLAVSEGLVGEISHTDSLSAASDEDDRRDAFSSGIPASIHDDDQSYTSSDPHSRTASSAYTLGSYYPSARNTRLQEQSQEAANFNFPLPGDTRMTRWPGEDTGQSFPFPAPEVATQSSRDSDEYYRSQGRRNPNATSDMSWLNLGANSRS